MQLQIGNETFEILFKKYVSPKKNKIAFYKSILASKKLVINLYSDNNTTKIGRFWENQFGGGISITHKLNFLIPLNGKFIIDEQHYLMFIKNSTKI